MTKDAKQPDQEGRRTRNRARSGRMKDAKQSQVRKDEGRETAESGRTRNRARSGRNNGRRTQAGAKDVKLRNGDRSDVRSTANALTVTLRLNQRRSRLATHTDDGNISSSYTPLLPSPPAHRPSPSPTLSLSQCWGYGAKGRQHSVPVPVPVPPRTKPGSSNVGDSPTTPRVLIKWL